MRITVIGSTGHTGKLVVAEGMRRGHRITAFTRRPEAVPTSPSSPDAVVTGNGLDPHAVRRAIADADAVIAIVTASTRNGPHQTAAVSRVVTEAMRDLDVRRLAVTSAYPIVGTKPRLPMALLRFVFADAYADASEMERIVSTTDLDWTIVRLNRLTDGPAQAGVRTSRDLLDKPSAMTRASAANVLLDIIEDRSTVRVAVNVAGPS